MNVTSLTNPIHFKNGMTAMRMAIVWTCVAVVSSGSAWGQPGRKTGSAMPAGAHAGATAGRPGTGPAKAIPGAATGKVGSTEIKIDPVTLPEGFTPPIDPPSMMTDEELVVPLDELAKLKGELGKYQTNLLKARSAEAERAAIKAGIRYRLGQLCLKSNRQNLATLRDQLYREINSCAAVPDDPKKERVKEFRQMVMQDFVNQATLLIENKSFYVRLHVIILLGLLDLTETNSKFDTKQEAFGPACTPLVKVISNAEQPESLKIPAANGLIRILRLGSPNVVVRTGIANAVIAELQNKKADPWYQMRLAGVLGAVNVELDQNQKPFVANALISVMQDNERLWMVRAEAAHSLGRVPMSPQSDPAAIVKSVGSFALALAKAAQAAPPQGVTDPTWRNEFIKLYLAFQPLDKDELNADKKTKAGLLNSAPIQAKPLYSLIVPMSSAVIHGMKLMVQQVQSLEEFVKANEGIAKTEGANPK